MKQLPWKWKGKDQFRWKGVWFHYNEESYAYDGRILHPASRTVFVQFTVRRDGSGWFARACIYCPEYGGHEIVTALVARRGSRPSDVLKVLSKEVVNERELAEGKARDMAYCSRAIDDILWGNRGRRAR
jgi:hypothetical protein